MSLKEARSRDLTHRLNHQATVGLRRLLKITVLPLLFIVLIATVPAQSALDGFDPNAENPVYVTLVQPDGKILIGGSFTTLSPPGGPTVTRNKIARLNPDGTVDATFNPDADSTVDSMALQVDGKILVTGSFHNIGGQPRNYIARLDPVTGLADSFNPNPNSGASCVAVQADGKILVGGQFNSIGGQQRSCIARLDPTTGLADSFDPGVEGVVSSIVVQPNGKILLGGGFLRVGPEPRNFIARVNQDGTLDTVFRSSTDRLVRTIAVQADGRVLVGGPFTSTLDSTGHVVTRNRIARLDATTGRADSFNPNADDFVHSIAVQADGRILAGGDFASIGGQNRSHLARLDPTTGLADSFSPNPDGSIRSISVQADGKIVVGAYFMTNIGGQNRNNIARLETDGRVDQTLADLNIPVGKFGVGQVMATAVQPDGKILIGGSFHQVLGTTRFRIARLNTDGTLDMAFNPDVNGPSFPNFCVVNSIAVLPDGKVLAGGNFTIVSGQTRNNIARLDATTGLADSFNPNANGIVYSIAVQPDGKILAGGAFTNIGGEARRGLARLDPATGLADSFNSNSNGSVFSLAVQADGKILAGGNFTSVGGQTRNRLARLDAATGLPDSFDPNANQYVTAIAVQADGRVLACGFFDHIGGQTRNFARLDATTGLADSFNPNSNGLVYSILVQADGKILAGGIFTSIGGQARNRIARLDATTGLADSFDPIADSGVSSIAAQADGKILVGGYFTSIGGETRSAFARLSNDTASLQDLAVTQSTIIWTRGGSSPQFTRVTFEYSTDNVNYTLQGSGTAIGSNWTLTGLNLPTGFSFYTRARGYYRSGTENGSESIAESVRTVFLAGPISTPTPTPPVTPIPTATPSSSPTPPATPTPSPTATPTPTPTPTPTSTPTATPGSLGNISTRLRVLSGDNALIGGMIATGTANKRVIIRAIGPSLIPFGVPGALANPTLDLFQGSTLLMSNDDWQTSTQQAEIAASGLAPSDNLESAIIWTLNPGQNYTAVVRGQSDTTGVGIVEAYDLDQAASSKLGNISTRGFVDVDDNVMIAGLIAGPGNGTSLKILVRALGPTLSDFGVAGALVNPTLDLVNSSGTVIRSNSDWGDDPAQRALIEAAGLAPSHAVEAALVETVAPGAYTAIVRGSNRGTGVGLVEAYNIP